MRTMGVDVVERDCTYREVLERDLRGVPLEPPDADDDDEDEDEDELDEFEDNEEDDDEELDEEEEDEEDERAEDRTDVLGAVRPQIAKVFAQFRELLESVLRRHPHAPVSMAVGEHVFLSGLARQVLDVMAPTLLVELNACLLYTSPSPRDGLLSRMPSSA